jgi:predicted Zn-dependent peptidase
MVKVPEKYLELGIDVLTDMVFNAKFEETEIEKEKFVVCEEIKMYKDQPADHVMDLLGGIMWPGNALGKPLTGSIATVKSFKRDKIVDFRDRNYHPGNMAVVVTGKANASKVFSHVSEKFSGSVKKKNPSFTSPALNQRSPRVKFETRETKQTHVALGFPLADGNMRQRFAYKLMNVILGGNMSSRLFEELREKYGLCYDISSSYKRHSDLGEIIIHSGVDSRRVLKSVVAILDELQRIRDLGVTADELQRAKEYAKGQFLLAMEGTATRMLWLGDRLMVHRRIPEVSEVLKRLDEVTTDEIKKACEGSFRASLANLAIIGDLSGKEKDKIKKELDKL